MIAIYGYITANSDQIYKHIHECCVSMNVESKLPIQRMGLYWKYN